MRVIKHTLYDQNGQETGVVLSAIFNASVTLSQKFALENQLINYAFQTLYPNQGLNIYRNMYSDTPSIVVLKDINGLNNIPIVI